MNCGLSNVLGTSAPAGLYRSGTAGAKSSGAGFFDLASAAAAETARDGGVRTAGAEAAQAPSPEEMLKAKYPGLHYHVFDAGGSYWKTRTDYPHYLLYRDGDKARETLENWRPSGPNPFYGSVNGQFIAPKEIRALSSVPPGSKAVVIHPKVQERMERDPAYAGEILARIDAWFAFDAARNEAHMPGCTAGMSQAVAIGEDGNICNACSSGGGTITCSKSGSGDEESWWDLRMARHAELMKQLIERQIERKLQASELLAAVSAKARLADMLKNGNLPEIFGGEISGIPTGTVLAMTREQVWGAGAVL